MTIQLRRLAAAVLAAGAALAMGLSAEGQTRPSPAPRASAPARTSAPARPGSAPASAPVRPANAKSIIHSMPAVERGYEVLLPADAKELKAAPVVIYLHPSGGPNFDQVKADWWPLLAGKGCILVMPPSKGKQLWPAGEDKFILDVLADVQTRYNTDPKRVILLGVSGGGQVALFLSDHEPTRWRAVIAVSANPVTVRGERSEWFYPNRQTLRTCPYFIINPLTQGSALEYWRQVQAKLNPDGASISILPLAGVKGDYVAPPQELLAWLDDVLAGKQPPVLDDPQKSAVAKLLAPAAGELAKLLDKPATATAPASQPAAKDGALSNPPNSAQTAPAQTIRLSVPWPAGFGRSTGPEDKKDSTEAPLVQVRLESDRWPIYLRVDARSTAQSVEQVLAAEEKETALRGLLYQVFHSGSISAGQFGGKARTWTIRVGAMTYPDRTRGWVSVLFVRAVAPISVDGKRWLSVLLMDETQQPSAAELAGILRPVLEGVQASVIAGPSSAPTTKPATRPATRPAPAATRPTTRPALVPATRPARPG